MPPTSKKRVQKFYEYFLRFLCRRWTVILVDTFQISAYAAAPPAQIETYNRKRFPQLLVLTSSPRSNNAVGLTSFWGEYQ